MANVGDGQKHGWGNGALTPEDAERFAQMFRPSWELDDAPFSAASPDDTIADADMRSLEKGGANPELQATLAKGTLLMPPPSIDAPARSPAAQRAMLNATMPLSQQVPGRATSTVASPASARPAAVRPSTRPAASMRGGPASTAAGARTRRPSYATDELLVPRKSKTGLVVAISVAALVAVGGIGALVLMSSGSKPEAAPTMPADNPTVKVVEAHPVPPPPPAPEPPPPPTATAVATKAAPPPAPEAPSTTAKPSPPPPPPPVAAAPAHPPRNSGASPAPPKPRSGGGSPIVHDVPF